MMILGILLTSLLALAFVVAQRWEIEGMRDDVRALQKQVNTMSAALDDLKAQVTAQTSLDASAVTLIQGIADKLANMPAGTSDADLKALADELRAGATPLAAAVAENTPAAAPGAAS